MLEVGNYSINLSPKLVSRMNSLFFFSFQSASNSHVASNMAYPATNMQGQADHSGSAMLADHGGHGAHGGVSATSHMMSMTVSFNDRSVFQV